MTTLIIVTITVFLLNIPFGYWRENVKKFSLQWFLAIHLPVPVIVVMRMTTDIGFAWFTYVFLISAFFFGQKLGSYTHKRISKSNPGTSSCMVMDLWRLRASE